MLGVYSFSSSVNTRGQYFIWIKFVANGLRTCHRLCNSKQTGDFGDDKSARRRRVSRSFFFPRHCEVCQPAAGSSEPLNDRDGHVFFSFFFWGVASLEMRADELCFEVLTMLRFMAQVFRFLHIDN